MTWIAAREAGEAGQRSVRVAPGDLVLRGSFVCEIDPSLADDVPILFIRRSATGEVLSLTHLDDGRLHFLHRDAQTRTSLSLAAGTGPLRLTYSWNRPAQRCLLTVETVGTGEIRQQEGRRAPALSGLVVSALVAPGAELHPALRWWVVSGARLQPGPGPCLAPESRIDTPDGAVPITALRRGTLVRTEDGIDEPVLWAGPVSTPALGSYRPVRLLAPYFGRERDLTVHPFHRVFLSGQDVEYLFGEAEVLVEARHLVNGQTALWADSRPEFQWYGVLLRRHAMIRAEGCAVESLHPGRLANAPDVARTTPLGMLAANAALPVFGKPEYRVAAAYEGAALSQALTRKLAPFAA